MLRLRLDMNFEPITVTGLDLYAISMGNILCKLQFLGVRPIGLSSRISRDTRMLRVKCLK